MPSYRVIDPNVPTQGYSRDVAFGYRRIDPNAPPTPMPRRRAAPRPQPRPAAPAAPATPPPPPTLPDLPLANPPVSSDPYGQSIGVDPYLPQGMAGGYPGDATVPPEIMGPNLPEVMGPELPPPPIAPIIRNDPYMMPGGIPMPYNPDFAGYAQAAGIGPRQSAPTVLEPPASDPYAAPYATSYNPGYADYLRGAMQEALSYIQRPGTVPTAATYGDLPVDRGSHLSGINHALYGDVFRDYPV